MAPAGALRDLTLALGAAVAALGSLLFIAWKIYFRGTGTGTDWGGWWERELRELRDRDPPGDALDWRQVLVLGLDGAGKSSVLHYICSQTARERIAPTRGFNSAQLYVEGLEMDLLEGQERCPECSRAAGGAGPAHALRAAGALPPAHQRDLGQLEHRHQRPPCEEPAGHPALPALSPHRGQKGSHPQHGPSLGSTEQGRKWLGGSPGAQTRW
ncbi:ADP-ribosylation factor-like protein 10 isoform X3 [Grus americana]|uniref:ADP-ribosylation factor-like protein 10 isoform X3 n=1 Tax=Grus americana TaxID=9117 RepID=UPI002408250B|nr:ADP-ribosylation factor-like protein 10 isoform X3 [Grus americana]